MALSRAARAHIEVEQAIREAPAALRAEVARIAADAMNRVADAMRQGHYQTAYEMLDSLTARMGEPKTH